MLVCFFVSMYLLYWHLMIHYFLYTKVAVLGWVIFCCRASVVEERKRADEVHECRRNPRVERRYKRAGSFPFQTECPKMKRRTRPSSQEPRCMSPFPNCRTCPTGTTYPNRGPETSGVTWRRRPGGAAVPLSRLAPTLTSPSALEEERRSLAGAASAPRATSCPRGRTSTPTLCASTKDSPALPRELGARCGKCMCGVCGAV